MLGTNLKSEPQNHYVQALWLWENAWCSLVLCFPFLTPIGTSMELEEPK